MYVAQMAFFARVADARVGGSYMTLLNTLANLGTKWPATLALAAVDSLALPPAWGGGSPAPGPPGAPAADGFYVLTAVCTCAGVAWLVGMRGKVEEGSGAERSGAEWGEK